ncbi:MAG: ATP-binding cassette domain-containing protein [Gemmatimonadetes bacterium]|nr:ATP-binding cassette domain-containing protein [Gemmatimonadota bacterium]
MLLRVPHQGGCGGRGPECHPHRRHLVHDHSLPGRFLGSDAPVSIRLADVHKAFGKKRILKGFSLEVPEGQTVAIVGPSGIGKSVTLKHVVGLLTPDEGTVVVDELSVPDLDRAGLTDLRRRVGFVFQFAALFDSMTVGDNVAMALRRLADWDPPRITARVMECLELVELDGMSNRYPSQLSGGQKKRAGLARALAPSPRYILYDEPTTGLDPVTKSVIDRLILRMRDDLGVTGLMVTHDMTSAYRVADRIVLLHDGKARFVGSPEEVRAAPDPVVQGFVTGNPALFYGEAQ